MIRLLKNTPIQGIPDCKVLMLSLIFVSVTSYEEKLKNNSKMHLSLGVEKLGGRSPVSDQAADGQSEEEDVGDLQRQYNTVFVNELRRPEEVRPVSGVEGSLCAPGVAEVAVGDPHVGQDPGAAAVLVHQVDTHHHHQGAALLTVQVRPGSTDRS